MRLCIACHASLDDDAISRTEPGLLRFCPNSHASPVVCQDCVGLTPAHFGLGEFRCPDCQSVMESSPAGEAEVASYTCDFCLQQQPELQVFQCRTGRCRGMVICRDCFRSYDEPDLHCPHCSAFLQDSGGVPTQHAVRPDRILLGRSVPPSEGCVQTRLQCSAAATATACNWAAETSLTTDDAMHLFLMSPVKAASREAVVYRASYEAARARLGGNGQDAEVRAEMRSTPRGEAAHRAAFGTRGEPEFPADVAHHYVLAPTDEHIRLAMANKCTVLLGTDRHWLVLYGCEIDAENRVRTVHIFDPLGGERSQQPWEALRGLVLEAYVVGLRAF
ncbi:hypothetical protein ACFQ78_31985 [Streptomyces sp. NPDC056519]|uniref:hypothetical protein n=1 Tax=Streptomyces sp. NPDC056519 TaxID=3345849 RepID=UPI0036C66FCA